MKRLDLINIIEKMVQNLSDMEVITIGIKIMKQEWQKLFLDIGK